MLLQLQRDDIAVSYTPGKDMLIADALSRAVIAGQHAESDELTDERVVYVIEATDALNPKMMKQLKAATLSDSTLQLLQEVHGRGCPKHRKQLDTKLYQYWPIRYSIAVNNGVLMTGDRLIIPSILQPVMLQKLHTAHQGVQRTKAHARKLLYWPGITKDIEQMVEACVTCQKFLPSNQKEPLMVHDILELKVAADIFEIKCQSSYLLVVDYCLNIQRYLTLMTRQHTLS